MLFTTDGSTPKAGGTASKYAGELTIDKDTVLARRVREWPTGVQG